MSLGLVGRKVGMMRIFTNDGDSIPVTVLDVSNNRVTQIKTVDNDGYSAVQVAYGQRRASRVTKPQGGHFAQAGVHDRGFDVLTCFQSAALGQVLRRPKSIQCALPIESGHLGLGFRPQTRQGLPLHCQ